MATAARKARKRAHIKLVRVPKVPTPIGERSHVILHYVDGNGRYMNGRPSHYGESGKRQRKDMRTLELLVGLPAWGKKTRNS